MFCVLVLSVFLSGSQAVEWEARNYPNPTAGQFKECGMNATANICDPDGVLSEEFRYRLNRQLQQFERNVKHNIARDRCDQKGVIAVMAVARHVRGSSIETVKEMANHILRSWKFNNTECPTSLAVVVSVEDQQFWVARDRLNLVDEHEFTSIFEQQKSLFKQGRKEQALTNIVEGLERLLYKYGQIRYGGEAAVALRRVRPWVWRALAVILFFFVLCCGTLLYCCVSREKSSGGGSERGLKTHESKIPIALAESCLGGVSSITSTEHAHPPIKIATVTLTLDYPHQQLKETNSKEELHENENPKTLDV